jgi:hypothetical protein
MKIKCPNPHLISFLSAFLIITTQASLLSQESTTCAENLRTAQSMFDRGQVEQVPVLLEGCLKSGFTREEELTAYKLIIQTLLFEDKLVEADSAMLAFLKKNPEYALSPTDHSSFVFLFNSFTVKPVIQVSFHFGTNLPFVTFVVPRSTTGNLGNYTSSAVNLYASLEAKIALSEKVEINAEPGFSQVKFTKDVNILGFGNTKYIENQMRIELPLSATYDFKSFRKLTPYARFGTGPAITLKAKAQAEFKPSDANNLIGHTGNELDRNDSRINLDIFAQAGGGIKYKTNGGYLFAELRSNFGFLNQVIKGGASSAELGFFYYYADDKAFNLNTLNFNVGYTQIFYKPSKKRE